MTHDSPPRTSRGATGARLLAAALAALLTGCAPSGSSTAASEAVMGADGPVEGRIVLDVGEGLATATVEPTAAGQAFYEMLPVRLALRDPMGQAKSGRLPAPIETAGALLVTDPESAGIYYWPATGHIGIFYDDLGQSVPRPGMVRIGTVETGLEAVAGAGNRFTADIGPA